MHTAVHIRINSCQFSPLSPGDRVQVSWDDSNTTVFHFAVRLSSSRTVCKFSTFLLVLLSRESSDRWVATAGREGPRVTHLVVHTRSHKQATTGDVHTVRPHAEIAATLRTGGNAPSGTNARPLCRHRPLQRGDSHHACTPSPPPPSAADLWKT